MDITVTMTDIEYRAFCYVAVSPQQWVENLVANRCREAMDEMVKDETERLLADPEVVSIPADREQIIAGSTLLSAAERQAEHEANPPTPPEVPA